MKKITQKLWLLSLAILFALTAKAQTPTTCSTAASYSYPITQTVTGYTNDIYWLRVTLGVGNFNVIINNATGGGKITNVATYIGSTCSSITLFRTDTLQDSTNVIAVALTNTVSTSYYFKLTNVGGPTTFSVNTAPACVIVGDIGFCVGQTVNLLANPINFTFTPTYTWTTAGLSPVISSSIAITPTTTTVYSLTCSNGTTTLTTSINIFPLPASSCNSCQMVQNGAFESYIHQSNAISNVIPAPPLINGSTNDLANWNSATVGSPDYYSYNFPLNSNVGVPNNFCSANTPAHSGNGYAGIYTYGTNSYREYLQEQLKCSLVQGQLYSVNFYASLGTKVSKFIANNIGAYFGTSLINTNTPQ